MTTPLYQNPVTGEYVTISITNNALNDPLDFTTVTGTNLTVSLPGLGDAAWTWSIQSATTTTLVLRHDFVTNSGEAPRAGRYVIWGYLLVGAVQHRLVPVTLTILTYPKES